MLQRCFLILFFCLFFNNLTASSLVERMVLIRDVKQPREIFEVYYTDEMIVRVRKIIRGKNQEIECQKVDMRNKCEDTTYPSFIDIEDGNLVAEELASKFIKLGDLSVCRFKQTVDYNAYMSTEDDRETRSLIYFHMKKMFEDRVSKNVKGF